MHQCSSAVMVTNIQLFQYLTFRINLLFGVEIPGYPHEYETLIALLVINTFNYYNSISVTH